MTDQSQTVAQDFKPTVPPRSARDEIADALEHAYGPLLLSLGFALFLAFADPAHEVMLIFASEVLAVPSSLWRSWPIVLIPLIGVLLFWLLSRFQKTTRAEVQFMGGLILSGGLLGLSTLATDILTIAGLTGGDFNQETAISAHALFSGYAFEGAGVVTRVSLAVAVFFYVPIALYEATRLAIWAQYRNASRPQLTLKNYQPYRADRVLLQWVGRLPLLGAAFGFASIVKGSEGTKGEEALMIVLTVICAVAALGKFALMALRRGDTSLNDRLVGVCQGSLPFGYGAVLGFVGLSTWMTATAEMAGPITIVSAFVILAANGLAILTMLSTRLGPGQFPLVLLVIAMMVAMSGAQSAFFVAGLFALLALGSVFFDLNKIGTNPLTWFAVTLAVGAAGLGVWQSRSVFCPSLAGCNLIQGVAPGDSWENEGLADLGSAYTAWLAADARRDVDDVVLIAAQGGGLFAGYHVAYDLAARQDASRNDQVSFADRVFAISGVSGGSVGATVFWAILQSGMCDSDKGRENPKCFRDAIHDVLGRDYLSASLSKLLFADNLDSVVPFSSWTPEPVDRGHALFERLNAAVNRTLLRNDHLNNSTRDLVKRGLRNSWRADGSAPLLFLNTTDMFTGARVIQSPVSCFLPGCNVADHKVDIRLPSARVTLAGADGQPADLTVGQAAVLSARFPVVTPPGRYRECLDADCTTVEQKQLADGGYFDNTGLETVADIMSGLERARAGKPITVYSYSIAENPAPRKTKGTWAAPIGGLVAATTARRGLTVDRFCNRWLPSKGTRLEHSISSDRLAVQAYNATLDLRENATHNFTLSWLIAPSSLTSIQNGVDASINRGKEALCTK